MEKQKKQLAVAFMVVLVAVVVVSVIGIIAMSNKPVILQGQIEATEIRISGKLPGRIDTFLVKEGQNVKVGDTLVVINSPEAWAKFRQVNALEDIAKYQNKKIDDGTREQIVRSVEELWNKSKSDLQLAKVTYDRIQNLYRDSVVTSQRKDEVEAVYKAAVAAERAAHQQYLLVKDGAQKEDKESARSLVDAARSTVNEVQALLMDARLTAPENGQISTIYPKRGELVGAGTPIMSLVVLDDCHVVLNVREDYMHYFRMNETFRGNVPALKVENIEFKIYYISPLGSFATWRSTKQTGTYDMKTFEIHALPLQPVDGIAVIKREIDRMLSRRIYFVACIVLPLFSLFFMGTIFGDGQMENLPIGVVDGDNTVTSRQIIRMVKVDPTFRVTQYYANETEARADVQKKNIYGYLSIPVGFEAKVMDGKKVALTYYYHYALLSVGSEIHGAFQSLLKNISVSPIVTHAVALGVGEGEIKSFLLPVTTQNHPLFNPDMDYSVYLTHPFFFVFLQVLLLLVTTYAIGSEGKFGTSFEWLQTAGGNMLIAIIGKLLPYTIIFIAMSIFANYIYFGIFDIPMDCGFWPLNLTSALFVLSTQALAVFLFSLFPALSIIISVVSMVGSLGATLSGVTFPVPHMYAPVYYASYLFPVRHFIEIGQTLLYGNYGYAYMWTNVVALLLFLLLPLLLLPHLKRSLISRKYDNIE